MLFCLLLFALCVLRVLCFVLALPVCLVVFVFVSFFFNVVCVFLLLCFVGLCLLVRLVVRVCLFGYVLSFVCDVCIVFVC